MTKHAIIIPFLQKECKLLANVPLLFDDNIAARTMKSEHIGAIIKKRSDLFEAFNGKTKCLLVDCGEEFYDVDKTSAIALHATFVLNMFAKSGASMCTQAFAIRHVKSHSMMHMHDIPSIGPPNIGKYEIKNNAEPKEIKALFKSTFAAIDKDKSLGISIKRFNGALTKTEIDDKIIDITICLESIFNAQTEISFRFALYNSILAEPDQDKRYDVFQTLKKLYSQRSNIVHGNKDLDHEWATRNWEKIVNIARSALLRKIIFLNDGAKAGWQEFLDKMALGV